MSRVLVGYSREMWQYYLSVIALLATENPECWELQRLDVLYADVEEASVSMAVCCLVVGGLGLQV